MRKTRKLTPILVLFFLLPYPFVVARVTAQDALPLAPLPTENRPDPATPPVLAPPEKTVPPEVPVSPAPALRPDLSAPWAVPAPRVDPSYQKPTPFLNAWATFSPNTSIRVRTTTATFAEGKTLSNTTEKLVILESVDETGYILKQLEAFELGGKRFGANPRRKRYDFLQQPVIEGQTIRDAPPTEIAVGMQFVPCHVRIYTSETPEWKQRTTVWYSFVVYPYFLRSETIRTTIPTKKEPSGKILSNTVTEVTDTAALYGFRRARFQTYTMQTTRQAGDTTIVCLANCSLHVPGGIISETIRETDRSGRLLRQTDANAIQTEVLHPSQPENTPALKWEPVFRPGRFPRAFLAPSPFPFGEAPLTLP